VTIELRRLLWGGAAGFLVLAALAGLIATASKDHFDERHLRILLTVVAALLCGSALMAGLRLLERGTFPIFGLVLAVAAPIGFVALLIPIWDEDRETERWGRIVLSDVFLIVSGLILASLRLAVAAVERMVLAVVLLVATALVAVNAMGIYYIWTFSLVDGESTSLLDWGGRALVALFLLAVIGYLLAPILERMLPPATSWEQEPPPASERTAE
jgi:hypothetical protein